jgi:hypothetical protein
VIKTTIKRFRLGLTPEQDILQALKDVGREYGYTCLCEHRTVSIKLDKDGESFFVCLIAVEELPDREDSIRGLTRIIGVRRCDVGKLTSTIDDLNKGLPLRKVGKPLFMLIKRELASPLIIARNIFDTIYKVLIDAQDALFPQAHALNGVPLWLQDHIILQCKEANLCTQRDASGKLHIYLDNSMKGVRYTITQL